MSTVLSEAFPLRTSDEAQLRELGQALWDWNLCGVCSEDSNCSRPSCPWSRQKRLQVFWKRYKSITEAYVPEFSPEKPALSSHDDLLKIIRVIRSRYGVPRQELMRCCFADRLPDAFSHAVDTDQNRAMNIAASIMFLTNCGTSYECADFLEDGGSSVTWQDDVAASTFVAGAYPVKVHPYFDETSQEYNAVAVIEMLTAKRLVNAGFKIVPTDDLRSHLTLDYCRKKRELRVFHCPAVLREMLLASKDAQTAPLLPRGLALETLDTLHHVLFPSNCSTQTLVSTLVRRHGFDEDVLQYASTRYRRDDDSECTYAYFGNRLAEIYDEMQDPAPRRGWERWLQKYSAQRYMLMVTTIGVCIAVVLGFLSLSVSAFQAWVSWQQWKHSVKQG